MPSPKKQTAKKYRQRPSPPYKAQDCAGLRKRGNDGQLYESKAYVQRGRKVYRWMLCRTQTHSPAQRYNSVVRFIKHVTTKHRIVLFSINGCHWCTKLEEYFAKYNLPVHVVNTDDHDHGDTLRSALYKRTGQRTFPSVFVGGIHIGGTEKTKDFLRTIRSLCRRMMK